MLGGVEEKPWWQRVDGLPPSAARARANWRPITKGEWSVVAASSVIILAINKLIIDDPGSSWFTVVYMGGLLGVGAVLAARWIKMRSANAPRS